MIKTNSDRAITSNQKRVPPPGFASVRHLASVMAVAILSAFLVQPALAEDNAPLKRGGFQLTVKPIYKNATIYITTQGDETTITPSDIKLGLTGKIDFQRGNGFIDRAGVFAGHCKRTNCGSHTRLWYRARDEYTGPAADIIELPENDWNINVIVTTTSDRLLLPTEKIALINRCKQNPSSTFQHPSTITLSANTRTRDISLGQTFVGHDEAIDIADVNYSGGDQSRHASFYLEVQCQTVTHEEPTKTPKTPANNDVGFEHGPMKVNELKLFLTTSSNAFTEPTPGTRCKKARVIVRMKTNKAGPVSFRLRKTIGERKVNYVQSAVAKFNGNNEYIARYEEEISVDKTSALLVQVEERVNVVSFSDWKKMTLHCTGAGGGGFTTPPGDDNRDELKSSFQGGFSLLDNSSKAKRNQCTRKAKALVWFTHTNSKNIHYSLDCGSLGNFSGTLQPKPIGGGKYRAAKIIPFSINNTVQAGCTLRTVAPGVARDHAKATRMFTCHKTAGHGRGNGFTSPPRPTHDIPKIDLPLKVHQAPKCKTSWKTSCTRKPVKVCKNKATLSCKPSTKRQCKKVRAIKCKKVAKRSCTKRRTLSCKKKQVRVCKNVRGKVICKTKLKKQCKPRLQKVCKIKMTKQCRPVHKKICSNKVTKVCKKKVTRQCEIKFKKSCQRKKQVICRR